MKILKKKKSSRTTPRNEPQIKIEERRIARNKRLKRLNNSNMQKSKRKTP
jgi:hypothetical protein